MIYMKKYAILGRLALFATALIWGTSFVILKNTLVGISVLWVLAIRFTISAAALLLLAGKRLGRADRESVKGSILIGTCLALAYIVQTYGLKYTTPGKNAFLTSVYCVMVPFFAWAVFKRKPGAHNILAAVLCLTGIGFVALDSGFGSVNIGDILTLACGVLYALHIILMEQYISSCDALTVSAVEFSAAAVLCLAAAVIFEPFPKAVPADALGGLLYLAVMCTGLCFFLQAWGMKYTPSSSAAMIMTLEAVFGTLFSVLLYGERLTAKLVWGFALIFVAVVISEAGTDIIKKLSKHRAGVCIWRQS